MNKLSKEQAGDLFQRIMLAFQSNQVLIDMNSFDALEVVKELENILEQCTEGNDETIN